MSEKWTTGNYVKAASGGIFVLCAGSLLRNPIKIFIVVFCVMLGWELMFGDPISPEEVKRKEAARRATTETRAWKYNHDEKVTAWLKSADLDEVAADIKKHKLMLDDSTPQKDDAYINRLLKGCKQGDGTSCNLLWFNNETYVIDYDITKRALDSD